MMVRKCGWAVLWAAVLLPTAAADDKADTALEALQGEYRVTKFQIGSMTIGSKGLAVTIKKGEMTLTKDGRTLSKDTIKNLDPTTKVKQLDLFGLEGVNKEKTAKSIYELKGDTLALCIPEKENAARPTEFKATKVYTLVVCERVKAKK
jgi:uncharacterized protein (TIGR03067 family)